MPNRGTGSRQRALVGSHGPATPSSVSHAIAIEWRRISARAENRHFVRLCNWQPDTRKFGRTPSKSMRREGMLPVRRRAVARRAHQRRIGTSHRERTACSAQEACVITDRRIVIYVCRILRNIPLLGCRWDANNIARSPLWARAGHRDRKRNAAAGFNKWHADCSLRSARSQTNEYAAICESHADRGCRWSKLVQHL